MAAIQEKVKEGKIVSFKFKAYMGRNEEGKQVFKCLSWYPEDEMTKAKSRKAAAAALWEKEAKAAYLAEKAKREQEEAEKAEQRSVLTFGRFVREVWLPLAVNDGEHRPSTVAMYTHILNVILPCFDDTNIGNIMINVLSILKN